MGDVCQSPDVSHKQLRIGDDLEEQGARLVVNTCLYLLWFREVGKAQLHTKVTQRVTNQRDGVAKQMFRGHDVQSCTADRRQGVVDGCHSRVERRHAHRSRQLTDPFFQIGGRGVGDTGIRRRHGTTAECVAHGFGRLKLKRRRIVDGHGKCPVSIRLLILRCQYLCFVLHYRPIIFLTAITSLSTSSRVL